MQEEGSSLPSTSLFTFRLSCLMMRCMSRRWRRNSSGVSACVASMGIVQENGITVWTVVWSSLSLQTKVPWYYFICARADFLTCMSLQGESSQPKTASVYSLYDQPAGSQIGGRA